MNLSPPAKPAWPTDQAPEDSCKSAGEFFATWMTSPDQIEAETYRGPGLDVTAFYLRVLYGLVDDKSITDGQLLWWFADTQKEAEMAGGEAHQEFLNTVVQPAVTFCGASVCRSLGWAGNADLAGIGVFASYYIEAALVTLYMAVLLAKSFRLWRGGRLLDAFLATLSDLVMGVFVFAAVVASASLHSILQVRNEANFSVTTYEIVTATLVTVFAVCPATLLYSLGGINDQDGIGPRPLLRAVFFALWALMLAVVNLGRATDPSRAALEAGVIGHPFEVYCQVIGTGPLEAVRVFAVASAGLGALWVLYLVFSRKFRRDGSAGASGKEGRRWRVVVAVLAWVVMWFFLGLFTALRARSIDLAGASDKSNEWSFGQIVAVATWAPVVLNFVYILFVGVEEGQGSKLPEGYVVVASTGNGSGGGEGGEVDEK
ncbi:hypothetical protein C8A01DRAFT_48188 [Parachaetomium inaequale]|uniref:Uncharacterized protein n=1 Tax=Parachaetomium inaequale TaxID=2588326 RepID=A0AAN6PDN8_9PEZI|nr:hypothetical protein C8A01DRAFT_48188 [Parachaetomium inaequale]